MATVTAGYTWTSGETVTPAKMNDAALPTVVVADDEVTNDKLSLTANAGEIKKALNADNAPPIYACRAWVAFDGTKDTTGAVSTANTNRLIRASGNVASVLRNGTGDYTINFTTAMPDANYAIQTATSLVLNVSSVFVHHNPSNAPSTSSFRFFVANGAASVNYDTEYIWAGVFR
jgi:hypothetical protein